MAPWYNRLPQIEHYEPSVNVRKISP
jgi:hypothetical protein